MTKIIRPFRFAALLAALLTLNIPTFYASPADSEKAAGGTAAMTAISSNVKARLDAEPELKDSNITVVTSSSGVVTLKGAMVSPVARVKAVEIAKATEGVAKVVNKIAIVKK